MSCWSTCVFVCAVEIYGKYSQYVRISLTALMHAAKDGRADLVRLLLDAGANKEAKHNVRVRMGPVLIYFSMDRVFFLMVVW